MKSETIVNASRVRALLKEMAAAPSVASEAVDWVNRRTFEAIEQCVFSGVRYPSGRLSCPPEEKAAETQGGAAIALLRRMVEKHKANPKYAETKDYQDALAIIGMVKP